MPPRASMRETLKKLLGHAEMKLVRVCSTRRTACQQAVLMAQTASKGLSHWKLRAAFGKGPDTPLRLAWQLHGPQHWEGWWSPQGGTPREFH